METHPVVRPQWRDRRRLWRPAKWALAIFLGLLSSRQCLADEILTAQGASPTLRLYDDNGTQETWLATANEGSFSITRGVIGASISKLFIAWNAKDFGIVSGANGVGFGINPQRNLHVYDFANSPTLRLEEGDLEGPVYAWDIEASQAGFKLIDDPNGANVTTFRVNPGAPPSSFVIASDGDVGMGTNNPQARLHVFPVNNLHANLRLETANSGVPGQAWDLAGNAGGFSLVDITGTKTPFAVEPATPTYTLNLSKKGSGMVGIGTSSPDLIGTTSLVGNVRHLNLNAGTGTARSIVQGQAGAESYLVHTGGTAGRRVVRQRVAAGKYYLSTMNDNLASSTEIPFAIDLATRNVGIKTSSPTKPLQVGDAGANDGNGAHVTPGGVWTNASSRTIKDDIQPITSEQARETVRALQPVGYRYKNEPEENYVGFIAEDVPELVATNDRKSLAPMDIVAVLTRVVQDQDRQLQDQNRQLGEQRVINKALMERLAKLEQRLME